MYARKFGLEPVVLRYSNVYGPGQRVTRGPRGVIAAWLDAGPDRGDPIELIAATRSSGTSSRRGRRPGKPSRRLSRRSGLASKRRRRGDPLAAEVLEMIAAASELELEVRRVRAQRRRCRSPGSTAAACASRTGWRCRLSVSAEARRPVRGRATPVFGCQPVCLRRRLQSSR